MGKYFDPYSVPKTQHIIFLILTLYSSESADFQRKVLIQSIFLTLWNLPVWPNGRWAGWLTCCTMDNLADVYLITIKRWCTIVSWKIISRERAPLNAISKTLLQVPQVACKCILKSDSLLSDNCVEYQADYYSISQHCHITMID